jgi:UDP-3-O-[3-hydroxymyristoyl] glucosamine N-acyltransferase
VSLSLAEIVDVLGGKLAGGDLQMRVQALAPLETAGPGELAFLSHPKYTELLGQSHAACVIVTADMQAQAVLRGPCLVADDPYLYFARLTQLWKLKHSRPVAAGIHPSAVVSPDALVNPLATIGPQCVIEPGVKIGAGTVLKANVFVGEGCSIGERCVIHAGVVIGADGFGFAPHDGRWEKIEQLGAVVIGDDVEIGANTCIDRGALLDTVIEEGVKLDNLIQIGHNVRVGKHTAMAGCVGVAGSAVIGAYCTIGGGAVVLGHLKIGDHVNVSAASVVTRSILKPGLYTGIFPIDDNASWEKNAATVKQAHGLRDRIRALEKSNDTTGASPMANAWETSNRI